VPAGTDWLVPEEAAEKGRYRLVPPVALAIEEWPDGTCDVVVIGRGERRDTVELELRAEITCECPHEPLCSHPWRRP